jgi:integrase
LSLDISQLPGGFSLTLAADFSLDKDEIQKGQAAVSGLLESLQGDERESAQEALETLTLVFSTGVCEGVDFPWHQVRAYHGQAAINMLKADGAPSRLETLRCQLDPHHKFRQDSEKFDTKRIHRFRTTLKRVLKESRNLGYMSDDDWSRVMSPHKHLPHTGDRVVSHGEFRALLAACQCNEKVEFLRDRLVFYLLYHGGLMLAELLAVNLDDLRYDQKTQRVTVQTGKAKNQKSRRVALPNEALISLENWLELRGNEPGALLSPVKNGRKVEVKRMSGDEVRTLCEERARGAGVSLFTPDELRKSAATQIGLAKAESKRANQRKDSAPAALFAAEDPDAFETADELAGSRTMATVCFPVWEISIKS